MESRARNNTEWFLVLDYDRKTNNTSLKVYAKELGPIAKGDPNMLIGCTYIFPWGRTFPAWIKGRSSFFTAVR